MANIIPWEIKDIQFIKDVMRDNGEQGEYSYNLDSEFFIRVTDTSSFNKIGFRYHVSDRGNDSIQQTFVTQCEVSQFTNNDNHIILEFIENQFDSLLCSAEQGPEYIGLNTKYRIFYNKQSREWEFNFTESEHSVEGAAGTVHSPQFTQQSKESLLSGLCFS